MTHLDAIPLWLAIPVAFFVLLGSGLTLLGTLGLLQLRSFYDRIHAPTMGTSWGAAGILLASMGLFSWLDGRTIIHELVIGCFVMITTPVTLMLLGRVALHRDRIAGSPEVPSSRRLIRSGEEVTADELTHNTDAEPDRDSDDYKTPDT
ncbi:monovalent cation/H(+) antiporter subunit G [Paracoccus sp. (in: a-proteobacteria)]|uniref:monovalent cation/H(+) antiporter subunit G n=1 Tax=Paracoccus sp. TaxID=267 RepID=UPI0026E0EEC9|nr:monovalent cation/H(+) antiporter subunit G [Paracoccus sp. (in: a-proteobacteria)]MDO5647815.1 monovalent cation/H(+) antiporter subunit G [Paracoccus sp. (in: a-proteobacteria)]